MRGVYTIEFTYEHVGLCKIQKRPPKQIGQSVARSHRSSFEGKFNHPCVGTLTYRWKDCLFTKFSLTYSCICFCVFPLYL